MANKPNQIKIVIEHARTENISERYPTRACTYYISVDEAQIAVERDLELRRKASDNPSSVRARSIAEIFDELSKYDYNNAKKFLRHTRYYSATPKDEEHEVSIVDVAVSREGECPDDVWVERIDVHDALTLLDPKDRFIVTAIHLRGYNQTLVAKALGISQPAVAKRLKKAEALLREILGDWL